MDTEICMPNDTECLSNNEEFNFLTEFANSDDIDIYTATAIIIKNYNESGSYIRWVVTSGICFITQLLIPIFVIIELIQQLKTINGVCPGTATWQTKATSVIMSLFLILIYLRKWEPLISRFIIQTRDKQKTTNPVTLLFLTNLEHYMSETIFTTGVIANFLTHCVNTIAGLFIIFTTNDPLNLSVNCMVLYYFNDISTMFVDNNLKTKCATLLDHSHKKIMAHTIQHEMSYRKWFDSHVKPFPIRHLMLEWYGP